MGIKKSLGGERLGTGNKMDVELKNFGRSTHDLGKRIKKSQAIGTLDVFYTNVGLNGDKFKIDLATKVRTLPTTGPIFGTLKMQLDMFVCPIRLYIAELHNNALGIGMKMSNVKLPIANIIAENFEKKDYEDENTRWISPTSLLNQLGYKGLGKPNVDLYREFSRKWQMLPLLGYWDIFKNYYANKQEEIGYVLDATAAIYAGVYITDSTGGDLDLKANEALPRNIIIDGSVENFTGEFSLKTNGNETIASERILVQRGSLNSEKINWYDLSDELKKGYWIKKGNNLKYLGGAGETWIMKEGEPPFKVIDGGTTLIEFPLENIDEMRENILKAPKGIPFDISNAKQPYKASVGSTYSDTDGNVNLKPNAYWPMNGLAVKTYLSDRFNNWLSTEWIDGENGIAEISAVDVKDGVLKMDALNLAQKVYDMLNRIAVSGGSYNDWQEAVYGEKTIRLAESPMYVGGMSCEIVFDEVVSSAESTNASGNNMPLGSLAGRGADRGQKGGNEIIISVEEPSIIIGLVSITPRLDYSQGNKWYTRLETLDDLHKPNLDGIGFQELITEEMAAWDTVVNEDGTVEYKSAGKQPAYIEYMTDTDEAMGDFADENKCMFMTFNRRYETDENGSIKDLTTYIDPSKFNYAFADASITAQNFWIQIGMDNTARRKMSAKQIPNL